MTTRVIVPTYNEKENLEPLVTRLIALPVSLGVVVVDDGSPDGTCEACAPLPVAVLRHACNLGQGAALQTGISYALRALRPDYIVTFDADGQHRASDIPALIAPLVDGSADVALGTRFARPEDAAAIPRSRRALLRAAIAFTRVSSGLSVTDAHNGLRAFTAEAAARLNIRHGGMAHASEILHFIHNEKLRWREVPVSIAYTEYSRQKGQRSLGALDIMWDLVTGRMR